MEGRRWQRGLERAAHWRAARASLREDRQGRLAPPLSSAANDRQRLSPQRGSLSAYGSVEMPFVLSVTVTSLNSTVMGGLQSGWNVAVNSTV